MAKKEIFVIETFEDDETLGVIGYIQKYGRKGYSWKYVCSNKTKEVKTNRFNPMTIINKIAELQYIGYEVICYADRYIEDYELEKGIVDSSVDIQKNIKLEGE